MLIKDLAIHLKHALDPFADTFLDRLIKMASLTKKMATNGAFQACSAIITNADYTPRLMHHVWTAMQNKNVGTRTTALQYISLALQTYRPNAIEHHGDGLELVSKCLGKGLGDAAPQVREQARITFWIYWSIWNQRGDHLVGTLDPAVQKQLQRSKPKTAVAREQSPTSVRRPVVATRVPTEDVAKRPPTRSDSDPSLGQADMMTEKPKFTSALRRPAGPASRPALKDFIKQRPASRPKSPPIEIFVAEKKSKPVEEAATRPERKADANDMLVETSDTQQTNDTQMQTNHTQVETVASALNGLNLDEMSTASHPVLQPPIQDQTPPEMPMEQSKAVEVSLPSSPPATSDVPLPKSPESPEKEAPAPSSSPPTVNIPLPSSPSPKIQTTSLPSSPSPVKVTDQPLPPAAAAVPLPTTPQKIAPATPTSKLLQDAAPSTPADTPGQWWKSRVARLPISSPLPRNLQDQANLLSSIIAHLESRDAVDGSMFRKLLRLSRENACEGLFETGHDRMDIWENELRFDQLLSALQHYLDAGDVSSELRENCTLVIKSLLTHQGLYCSGHEDSIVLVLLRLLSNTGPAAFAVYAAAQDALTVFMDQVPSETALTALSSALQVLMEANTQEELETSPRFFRHGTDPCVGCFRYLKQVARRCDRNVLIKEVPNICAFILEAINDQTHVDLRKTAVELVVTIQGVVRDEDEVFRLLAGLSKVQQVLITYYLEKNHVQSSRA